MAVSDVSWSKQARRRGRTIAIRLILGGCGLVVVIAGVLLADGRTGWLRAFLILALVVALHLILHGWRRLKIEASPWLKPPLILSAASSPGSFERLPEPRPAFGIRVAGVRFVRYPHEVRIANGTIEWHARLRDAAIPTSALRRVRANTMPQNAVVLEFEGDRQRLILVTGGFADFLEALTVTCPWVEVSSEIVDRFGSWSGKTNGFFVESLDPAPGGG